MSVFTDVNAAPPIVVFALSDEFRNDKADPKVNLTVGAYRNEECKPWVLPVVKDAEKKIFEDQSLNHEYLPITGLPDYSTACLKLLLGNESDVLKRAGGCQALGGTGALYLGYSFAKRVLGLSNVLVSKPTWANHKGIGTSLGYHVHEYRYWKQDSCTLDLEGMLEDLKKTTKSLVVLHACAHNPTGVDPTHEQWDEIAKVVKEQEHFPLFDIAYQGFSTGSTDTDAYCVREFAKKGFELFSAQSFSKNFGLYNERVGHLAFVSAKKDYVDNIVSQLKVIVRQTYSNPPTQGCRIVSTVLNDPELKKKWEGHVKTMADRILQMRALLFDKLTKEYVIPGQSWDHIKNQTGMFCYTGLLPAHIKWLKEKRHIYLMPDGRINMCGLTKCNMDYVAKAFMEAYQECSKL